jgi:hypothetical protein
MDSTEASSRWLVAVNSVVRFGHQPFELPGVVRQLRLRCNAFSACLRSTISFCSRAFRRRGGRFMLLERAEQQRLVHRYHLHDCFSWLGRR